MGEEARHQDPCAELAERRLGTLTVRELQRELRVAAACGERQRESASKPRIYICDRK
jgi:hypothetical protein